MTAIPVEAFLNPGPRRRVTGRLLEALLGTLWRVKAAREGFDDIETVSHGVRRDRTDDPAGHRRTRRAAPGNEFSGISPEIFAPGSEERRDFYRCIEQGRWSIRDATDRRIADALAEGATYRQIMRTEHVGQFRIERVLYQLVNGRREPWHWRPGKPREKAGKKIRERLRRKRRLRRSGSTRP